MPLLLAALVFRVLVPPGFMMGGAGTMSLSAAMCATTPGKSEKIELPGEQPAALRILRSARRSARRSLTSVRIAPADDRVVVHGSRRAGRRIHSRSRAIRARSSARLIDPVPPEP